MASRPPLYLDFRTTHPDVAPPRPLEVFELSPSVAVARAEEHHVTGVDEATLRVDDSVEIAPIPGELRKQGRAP